MVEDEVLSKYFGWLDFDTKEEKRVLAPSDTELGAIGRHKIQEIINIFAPLEDK